ncbi:hypothetical protein FI667_g3990, partial [Globisporangium splendens]
MDANASVAPPPPPSTVPAAPPMTNEEMFAHQLDLHKKIQEQMQQQLQLQKEMSLQMGQAQQKQSQQQAVAPPPPPPPPQSPPQQFLQQPRQSLSAVFAKVEPDLGDNVFDMLDDLIMIPSGAVAPERNSLSKQTVEVNNDDELSSSGRDSLADILESLDMDLDEYEMQTNISKNSFVGSQATTEDSRDSFDDLDDLDDLDLDFDGDMEDHGIDDEDAAADGSSAFDVATEDAVQPEDYLDMRRSSFDMVASISGSTSSISQNPNGNMCTLIWEGGLLGLRLRMSQSRMLPAVSKLTGRSSIFGIHLVDMGDLLMQIGSRLTRDMEFMEAIDYLKEVEKPCKLVFRRTNADPMAVKAVQPLVKSEIAMKLAKKFEELAAAENEKSPATPVVKMEARYEVKWLDGPLGISLIASKDVPYPLVTRITGKNRSPQVQDVQPGHYLVQIGSYNTADGNFNTAIKFLQKVSKPVSLFFCPGNKKMSVRPDVGEDEYDHVWEKKQALAFTVKPDAEGRMVVADLGSAKSIKVKVKGGPNLAAFVNPGDRLEWINDDHTKDLSFHEALLKLRMAKRPLVIRFKKPPPPEAMVAPPVPVSASLPSPAHDHHRLPPAPNSDPEVSPNAAGAKGMRNLNPLKKIAVLGAYSKENSLNNANGRGSSGDLRKSPQTTPEPVQSKKTILVGSEVEVKRVNHDSSASQFVPKSSAYSNNAVNPASTPTSSGTPTGVTLLPTQDNNQNNPAESRRPNEGQTKLLNLELLNGIRKAPLTKASSDPSVTMNTSAEKVAAHAPLKPLTRETRNPGGVKPVEEPVVLLAKSNDHSAPLPKTYTGEEGEIYEVIWPEGTALGLTLRVHPTTRFPVVARVTGTSNLKNIEHVSPGDILFAANGMDIVPQPKFKQTLENLSKLPKPAFLRFRRAQPVVLPAARGDEIDHSLPRGPNLKVESEYEIVWRENANLGLVFSSDADVPKVTKVDIESGGPIISRVTVGDVLTWIGPLDIHGSSFHQSMATLRAVKRPVVLRFRKRHPGHHA